MPLQVYNTLTRRKEEFKPLHEGRVGIYVCGPTVYGHSHIGHAKSYVSFDVIVRYMRYVSYKVLYVQNITDVGHLLDSGEDRVLKQSKIDQVHPMQVVEMYTKSYFEDMDALGVQRPDISPRASGHIIEQIEIIKELIKKGYAYEAGGSVYFDVSKFVEYGKLSGRSVDEMESGVRVEVKSEKRHPADFALWKKAEPEHIMRWQSPWGEGYPGWHVECSAMSMKYLGETFDIHGGGLENQFPHHECEIAQSEGVTGHPFVRYWLHNNMVTVNGQKMGKSLGNSVSLKDLFKKFDPLVIRFFILQSHYRSTLDFSDEALQGAKVGLEKLLNAIRNLRAEITKAESESRSAEASIDLASYKSRFLAAMDDDFNSPQAIAVLFDLAREVNAMLALETKFSPTSLKNIEQLFSELGGTVLGLIPSGGSTALAADAKIEAELVQLAIDIRKEVRNQKLWAMSDLIRDGLKKIGIVLEDKKDGTVWRKG
ncbi:MAG: cysteine--tRNA ligase [Ignavibacteriales bacterium]|nr:cysteine--tRNA ligase [Ignavibacteriales bacterium]